uniref:Retrovirus-related Pol polyprotein from transposon TNT 1-94 n=1 Tax=Cajanus cajan TaxID=3821 RepID=A0A151QLP3_CAJCA|nr:Retrovirus-related Pol polyprotein from transposon TNT 1-94 [Cajanus cajan]
MSNTIRIEKFNGKNSFNLWRIKMRALLKEQRVWGSLVSVSAKKENIAKSEEKPTSVKNEDLVEQEEKAHSLILLSLSDEVLYEVADCRNPKISDLATYGLNILLKISSIKECPDTRLILNQWF